MAKLKSKYRMIAINPKHFEYTQIKFYLVLLPFLLIAFYQSFISFARHSNHLKSCLRIHLVFLRADRRQKIL